MAAVPELPADYYLHNFNTLLSFVGEHHAGLLDRAQQAYLQEFDALGEDAKRLYIRMVSRKGPLFRYRQLAYEEIADLGAAIAALQQAGFAGDGSERPIEEFLHLHTRSELLALSDAVTTGDSSGSSRQGLRQLRKAELIATLSQQALTREEPVVEPLRLEELRVIKLLFFGNFNQDMTEFVLSEMGVTTYESYRFEPAMTWLKDRAALELALALDDLAMLANQLMTDGDVEALVSLADYLPVRPASGPLSRRFDRLLNRIARELERHQVLDAALPLYQRARLPPARERQARILHQKGAVADALLLCEQIAAAPMTDSEAHFAGQFSARLRGDKQRRRQRFKPVQRQLVVSAGSDRVELATVAHINEHCPGETAYYVENTLLPGIFGLVFWDVLFATVEDAFFNPFQRGPADLYDDEFCSKRAALIAQRFAELPDAMAISQAAKVTFDSKYGLANPYVAWRALTPELLSKTIMALGTSLLPVFERILRDPRHHRSGFPDLVVFAGENCRLVEVKGPGDKLQENQRLWLAHFAACGIDAEVLDVSYV